MTDWPIAIGTWILALGTLGLARMTWILVKTSEKTAEDQVKAQREFQRVRLALIRRDRYESEGMQRYRVALADQLHKKTLSSRDIDTPVPNFFDVTGALLRWGYISKELVPSFFAYAAKRYWQALEPCLREDQDTHKADYLWVDFEYFVREIGGPRPTPEQMEIFLQEELRLGT